MKVIVTTTSLPFLFMLPSCDGWPKISENLLWIFPGSNWLNPEGGWVVSRTDDKCQWNVPAIAEISLTFLTLIRLSCDISLSYPDVSKTLFTAARINGSAVPKQACTFNNAARNFNPFLDKKAFSWFVFEVLLTGPKLWNFEIMEKDCCENYS